MRMVRPALALVALVVAVTGSLAVRDTSVANGSVPNHSATPVPGGPIALTFDDLPAVSTRRDLDTWKEITEAEALAIAGKLELSKHQV